MYCSLISIYTAWYHHYLAYYVLFLDTCARMRVLHFQITK